MKLIKYILNNSNKSKIVGILTDTYDNSLDFIQQISNELKKDYPKLQDKDIHIKYLAGVRHARQFAVEANVGVIKKGYESYPQEWLKTF